MVNSAVDFVTRTRVHVAIFVSDLTRSLDFYKTLFGQGPTKLRPGYAKFEVPDPPVNYTLNESLQAGRAGGVSHFGIQVKSSEEVASERVRLEKAGVAVRVEDHVTCCYAVQDKIWARDPDGNEWEIFVVLEADAAANPPPKASSPCCVPG